jgi:hypothetical protein
MVNYQSTRRLHSIDNHLNSSQLTHRNYVLCTLPLPKHRPNVTFLMLNQLHFLPISNNSHCKTTHDICIQNLKTVGLQHYSHT